MARKTRTFRVQAIIKAWTEIEVPAATLEQATEVARTLKVDDFAKFEGELNDFSLKIVGVQDDIPDLHE